MSSSESVHGQPLRAPSALEQTALAWVARVDRGLNEDERSDFERWLAADARHGALFLEFDGTWEMLDRVSELDPAEAATLVATECSVGPAPRQRRPLTRLATAFLTAAAVFALTFLGWNLLKPSDPAPTPFATTARTSLGEQRILPLPDGSLIRLNTASSVEIHYTATARMVRLAEGEAHFTVAKDSARPFSVSAGSVTVRAVGTAFNVRVRTEAVEVLVTAGKVRVKDVAPDESPGSFALTQGNPTSPVRSDASARLTLKRTDNLALSAGEVISIPRSGYATREISAPRPVTKSPIEVERALAWQERRLEFVSESLATMAAEFNRYNRVKLVITDPALAAEHFGGNFRADDPAGFVHVLEASFRVVAEYRPDETILRPAP